MNTFIYKFLRFLGNNFDPKIYCHIKCFIKNIFIANLLMFGLILPTVFYIKDHFNDTTNLLNAFYQLPASIAILLVYINFAFNKVRVFRIFEKIVKMNNDIIKDPSEIGQLFTRCLIIAMICPIVFIPILVDIYVFIIDNYNYMLSTIVQIIISSKAIVITYAQLGFMYILYLHIKHFVQDIRNRAERLENVTNHEFIHLIDYHLEIIGYVNQH